MSAEPHKRLTYRAEISLGSIVNMVVIAGSAVSLMYYVFGVEYTAKRALEQAQAAQAAVSAKSELLDQKYAEAEARIARRDDEVIRRLERIEGILLEATR